MDKGKMNRELSATEIKSFVLIRTTGKDAERYLNNRLSNNIKALKADRSGIFAAALSPQGRTEAFFHIIKEAQDQYFLIADGSDYESTMQILSRYKVRDQISLENQTPFFRLVHLWSAEGPDYSELISSLSQADQQNDILCIFRNRFGKKGLDVVIGKSSPAIKKLEEIMQSCCLIPEENQKLLRLKERIPEFPHELGPDYLFQESGLEGALSTSKGCYVGQEVTQKIASFAELPARLMAFSAAGKHDLSAIPACQPDSGQKIGKLLSSVYSEEEKRTYGFARISLRGAGEICGFLGNEMITFLPVSDFTSEQ